jgi:hypothetical protein
MPSSFRASQPLFRFALIPSIKNARIETRSRPPRHTHSPIRTTPPARLRQRWWRGKRNKRRASAGIQSYPLPNLKNKHTRKIWNPEPRNIPFSTTPSLRRSHILHLHPHSPPQDIAATALGEKDLKQATGGT